MNGHLAVWWTDLNILHSSPTHYSCYFVPYLLRVMFSCVIPACFFVSVQFSCSVVSDSLRPHESQHAKPPCPSPTPGVQSNSHPSSQWCHPAISSSVIPFSSCPQSLPASESFPVSQLFSWGGQSTGVSAFASFLPKDNQDWSPLEWTGWISLKSKGLSRVFSNTQFKSINFLCIASCYYDFSTNFSINLQAVHQWCALMDFKGGLKERV